MSLEHENSALGKRPADVLQNVAKLLSLRTALGLVLLVPGGLLFLRGLARILVKFPFHITSRVLHV